MVFLSWQLSLPDCVTWQQWGMNMFMLALLIECRKREDAVLLPVIPHGPVRERSVLLPHNAVQEAQISMSMCLYDHA